MKWRCINDHITSYCDGEPNFAEDCKIITDAYGNRIFVDGKCKNDHKSCPKRKTFTELDIKLPAMTSAPVEKPKTIKGKKEVTQTSMF
jgi:hypothetical protein